MKTLNIEVTGSLTPCEGCAFAKAKAKAVPKFSTTRATHAGERLCTDISGPYKKSIIGSNYWVLVVDDYSSKAWSFFVKKKSEMSKIVENLVIKLKSANYILKKLRCDNGGENFKALTELCEKHGLAIEITAPYTPQQNGIVERKFATIRDRSSAAMIKAKFSEEAQGTLWAEAANTHTRLTNIVSNSSGSKCPDWKFYNKQPMIYRNLIEFGRIGYVTLEKKKRN